VLYSVTYCSVQSRCIATTARWADMPGPLRSNDWVNTNATIEELCFLCSTYRDIVSNGQGWSLITLDERPSIFIRDKLIFSSERVLQKDYDRKGSIGRKNVSDRESQGA
jgi:hypothetical protein